MDYTKMTKQELIAQLEEQSHLKEAVEAKDVEISGVRRELEETKLQVMDYPHLEKRFKALESENESLKNKIKSIPSQDKLMEELEKYKKGYQDMLNAYNKLVPQVNSYTNMTRSFMKAVQGSLENAVEYENLLSQALKG